MRLLKKIKKVRLVYGTYAHTDFRKKRSDAACMREPHKGRNTGSSMRGGFFNKRFHT